MISKVPDLILSLYTWLIVCKKKWILKIISYGRSKSIPRPTKVGDNRRILKFNPPKDEPIGIGKEKREERKEKENIKDVIGTPFKMVRELKSNTDELHQKPKKSRVNDGF